VLLSQAAEYALRAVLRIASRHPDAMTVSEIAEAVDAPRNYLGKTLGQLARHGVLASARGPGGGYRLMIEPPELTLDRVVNAFAPTTPRPCLLRRVPCDESARCAAHERWKPAANAVDEFFRRTTVADLLVESVPPRTPSHRTNEVPSP
jgi:Rrf2 family protein